jgi:DNA-binding GntR family transcriptional regulator
MLDYDYGMIEKHVLRKNGSGEESETLVDFAYTRIMQDVTAGALKPDTKINLPELCERYETSQTPIKQALNRLIVTGLVENIPQRGYRVRHISWNEIDEIFELRLMMETAFAAKVIQSVNSNSLLQEKFESNLNANLESARNFATVQDFLDNYSMDRHFHELFILASGNHLALRMYRLLNTHTYATHLYGRQPKEKIINGILEHRCIYDAVKAGNVSDLQNQLTVHTRNAREAIYFSLKVAHLL